MSSVLSERYGALYIAGFLLLAASFIFDLWHVDPDVGEVVVLDSTITAGATVRLSAAELVRQDGDTSMLSCYACHERGEEPVLEFDDEGRLIWEEHKWDFELEHGRNHRNDYCYTCHLSNDLEKLRTPSGKLLNITQGNLLCGSCHGPEYRDWELNVHGRANGFWDPDKGAQTRVDCTSCHNAHIPAFPKLRPWPAPQPLRTESAAETDSTETR